MTASGVPAIDFSGSVLRDPATNFTLDVGHISSRLPTYFFALIIV